MTVAASQPSLRNRVRAVVAAYGAHSHVILFYSLLATLAVEPVLVAFGVQNLGMPLALAMNLMASVLGLQHGRLRTALLLLALAAVAARLATLALPASGVSIAPLTFWSVIALFAAADSARFAIRARVIEAEHVYAALNVYLLAGVFFGLLDWTVEQFSPGSYIAPTHAADGFDIPNAIYFSFVTLATLGYGDIVPHSAPARHLAIVEAVAGQLYLTVMIARLVGSWRQGTERFPPD